VTGHTIEPLDQTHDLGAFTCGTSALDAWLRDRAMRNQETGDSRTFVIAEYGRVIAYYALSAASAARVALPGSLRRNAPDPVSLLLLGQLAVDRMHRGKGLGSELLRDACMRTLAVLQHAGFRALATHPIDDDAIRFYARFGFTSVPDSRPPLMVLSVRHLTSALAASRR
jgi:predicted N-acetyltransferase YhbS